MGIALFKGEDSKLALPPPTDWGNPIRGVPFDGSYDYFPALHPVGRGLQAQRISTDMKIRYPFFYKEVKNDDCQGWAHHKKNAAKTQAFHQGSRKKT